eukprot:1924612-Pyramimonas_sp.AAC.2
MKEKSETPERRARFGETLIIYFNVYLFTHRALPDLRHQLPGMMRLRLQQLAAVDGGAARGNGGFLVLGGGHPLRGGGGGVRQRPLQREGHLAPRERQPRCDLRAQGVH